MIRLRISQNSPARGGRRDALTSIAESPFHGGDKAKEEVMLDFSSVMCFDPKRYQRLIRTFAAPFWYAEVVFAKLQQDCLLQLATIDPLDEIAILFINSELLDDREYSDQVMSLFDQLDRSIREEMLDVGLDPAAVVLLFYAEAVETGHFFPGSTNGRVVPEEQVKLPEPLLLSDLQGYAAESVASLFVLNRLQELNPRYHCSPGVATGQALSVEA